MLSRSIRWRLQLWIGFLLICVLTGFGVTVWQLHRLNRFAQIDDQLERRLGVLGADLRGHGPRGDHEPGGPGGPFGPRRGGPHPWRSPPDQPPDGPGMPDRRPPPEPGGPPREFRLSQSTQGLFEESQPMGYYYALWARPGFALRVASNAPPSLRRPEPTAGDTTQRTRSLGVYREVYQFTEMGDCLLVGRNIAADLASMRAYAFWILGAGLGMLALGCGGVWWLARRALRPVEAIGAAAGRISAGNLSERIDVQETDDELGHLAGVLNSMFGRLEAAFAQQRQFTADASHELRTPLTVMISEAQTALARERSAADYRESVEHCLEAAQQMRRLSESLLELARFDAGQEVLHRSSLDLAACVRAQLNRLHPLIQSAGVTLEARLAEVDVPGDPDRLEQVVANLVLNAIHYNKPGGRVEVTTASEAGLAVLRVTDTGIGIAPEDLPHVFERFYRADKSRARAQGRSGLGLAICQSIVSAHGGTLQVESTPGVGTMFTVRLPAGPAPSGPV